MQSEPKFDALVSTEEVRRSADTRNLERCVTVVEKSLMNGCNARRGHDGSRAEGGAVPMRAGARVS
jgi:hypothetical protein